MVMLHRKAIIIIVVRIIMLRRVLVGDDPALLAIFLETLVVCN